METVYNQQDIIDQCDGGTILDTLRGIAYDGGRCSDVLQIIRETAPMQSVEVDYLNNVHDMLKNVKPNNSFIYIFLQPDDMDPEKVRKNVLHWLCKSVNDANNDCKFTPPFILTGLLTYHQRVGNAFIPIRLIQVQMPTDLGRYRLVGEVTPNGHNNQLGSVIEYFTDEVFPRDIQRLFDQYASPKMQCLCTDCGVRRYRTDLYLVDDTQLVLSDDVVERAMSLRDKYQVLGSSCLQKYIPDSLLRMLELIQKMRERKAELQKRPTIQKYSDINTRILTLPVRDILARSFARITERGYFYNEPDRGKQVGTSGNAFHDLLLRTDNLMDYDEADKCIAHIQSLDTQTLNETMRSVVRLFNNSTMCNIAACRFVGLGIQHYRTQQVEVQSHKARSVVQHTVTVNHANTGNHFGNIGDKINSLPCLVVNVSGWKAGRHGNYRVVKCEPINERTSTLVFFHRHDDGIENVMSVELSCVVQKHDSFQGKLYTIVGAVSYNVIIDGDEVAQ